MTGSRGRGSGDSKEGGNYLTILELTGGLQCLSHSCTSLSRICKPNLINRANYITFSRRLRGLPSRGNTTPLPSSLMRATSKHPGTRWPRPSRLSGQAWTESIVDVIFVKGSVRKNLSRCQTATFRKGIWTVHMRRSSWAAVRHGSLASATK
jgi:hypothetical protein